MSEEELEIAIGKAVSEYATRESHETAEQFRWRRRFVEGKLIGLTMGLVHHPAFMDGQGLPCACDECSDCD